MLDQICGLILSFLSNRCIPAVLDEKFSQEYPVNAAVPQGSPFLVLHFSYYILTFIMMLSVILLSILMIRLSILNVIRHLIYGNNKRWLLNLNLVYEILWTEAESGLLISILENHNLFHLSCSMTLGSIDVKMDGSALEKKSSLICWGCLFHLNSIVTVKLSVLPKLPPRKLEPWSYVEVFCPKVALYNYKSTRQLLPYLGWWYWLLLEC